MTSASTGERRYSIGELAELTGVSRRTVHFYVQRRLIDPPLGLGRGRHYDERHVEQILRVRELQRQGVPLGDMAGGALARPAEQQGERGLKGPLRTPAQRPSPGAAPTELPAVTPVVRISVDQNVTVEVSQGVGLTPEFIAELTSAVCVIVEKYGGVSETDLAAEERRPRGVAAGSAPQGGGDGTEPAPPQSAGPETRAREPQEEEEP